MLWRSDFCFCAVCYHGLDKWMKIFVSFLHICYKISGGFFFMPTREKHVFLQRLQQTIWQLAKTNLAELPLMHFFVAYIGQGCCLIYPVLSSLLDACFCFPLTVVKSMSREYPFQWVFFLFNGIILYRRQTSSLHWRVY